MGNLTEYANQGGENKLATPVFSIIVPVYEEEDNLKILHERIADVMREMGGDYEIVYVDDGSNDGSFARLSDIATANPQVVLVQLRRNFGQTAALAAGINNSSGQVLIFMDADLQNDPADIPLLLSKLEEGFDVVSGWRINRQDRALSRKIPSKAANWLISKVTGVRLHDYGCTLKAYRREVIDHIHLYGEMHRFIPAHAAWVGAKIAEVPVQHHKRVYGKSKYGILRTAKVLLDLLTVKFLGSYSTKPIYIFGGLGMTSVALSLFSITVALFNKMTRGVSLIASPLLLLSAMLFIIGVELILMGFIAEIGVRTYHESQSKPTYIVRQVIRARTVASRGGKANKDGEANYSSARG